MIATEAHSAIATHIHILVTCDRQEVLTAHMLVEMTDGQLVFVCQSCGLVTAMAEDTVAA